MADKKQKVLLKRSSTAGKMPNQITGSTVENGELFMNIASDANATNFLTTLKAGGNSGITEDYIKWSDDKYNEKKYSPITHNHDDRYYTETEIDGKLNKKSNTGHTHSATAITSGTLDIARIPTGTGSTQVALGNHDHDDVYATIKDVEDNELIISTAINKIIESVGLNEDCSTQFDGGESLTSAINKKVNITDRINSAYTAYSATTSVSAKSATTATSAKSATTAISADKVNNKLTIGGKTFDGSSAITIEASDLGLSSALKYCGKTTSVLSGNGATTNPIIIDGNNHTATTGCVVIVSGTSKEYVWDGSKWSELGDESSFKIKQAAILDPTIVTGSGLTFIASISQNTNGVISATKKLVDLSGYSPTGHSHSNYSLTGHSHSNYAASSHVNASGTTGTSSNFGHVKLVSGNVSGKTYKDGEAAAASHNHDNVYQPKGSYLTSESYKGTITGVTAGSGLTGGGTKSSGSSGLTLHVGSGAGITVTNDGVSISTEYQNKIASGVSAYTMSTALSGALEDVEFVIANALTTINASAGFNEDGTSTLDGGESLTSAIKRIDDKIDADTKNTTGSLSNTTKKLYLVGASAHAQSIVTESNPYVYIENSGLVSRGGIRPLSNGGGSVGSNDYRFNTVYANNLYGNISGDFITGGTISGSVNVQFAVRASTATTANSASTVPFSGLPTGTTSNTVAVGNHTHSYAASSHVNASATTSAMGHVKLVSGNVSGKTYKDGEAAAASHNHDNVYQPKGDYAASSHVNATATTSAMGHVKLASGELSGKTSAVNGEAAASYHKHSNYSTTGHTHTRTISSGTSTYYLLGWTSKTANTSTNSMTFYTSSTNVYMQNGNLYAASDERLKNFAGDVDVDLDGIKRIPKKYYTWKEDKNNKLHIGTSAQKLQEIYPELVSENEEGKLAVSYDRLTIIALSAVDKLYDMINELKNENNILKDEIEKLKNK